jgi:large subunit ribosomal protein L3
MIQQIIGKKLGMTQVYGKDNKVAGVTVIEAGPCTITQVKTTANDGYNAVQLGFGSAKRLSAAEKGHLKGLGEFRYLREARVAEDEKAEVGQKIDVSIFKPGDLVDVIGTSIGKGFAGVVKRYHFKGGKTTHGASDRVRAPGSLGPDIPDRVMKGKKLPGHMGDQTVTARNIVVVEADSARNLLLIKGAVPGANNGLVIIKKSSKGK